MAPNLASAVFASVAVLPCSTLLRSRSGVHRAEQVQTKWHGFSATELLGYPFNFTSGYISHQNLGGAGPDHGDESIVFKNIGSVGGSSFDMRMVAAKGAAWVGNVTQTQLDTDHEIAQLNIASGTTTKVNVHLLDSATGEPVVVPRLFLTVLDIDAGSLVDYGNDPNTEGGVESYTIWPMSEFYVSATHLLQIDRLSASEYNFTATEVGGLADNPTHPMDLNSVQKNRAVMVEIRNRKFFEFTFAASRGTSHRNVMFSGPSALGFEGTPGACLMSNSLDLGNAAIKTNTLDQQSGPAVKNMFISNAMMVKGEPVNLIVRVVDGDYEAQNSSKTGLFGGFAHINLKPGLRVGLSFEFVKDDASPIYVPDLFFTFADLDQGRADGSYEAVSIASDSGTFFISKNSTLSASPYGEGYVTFRSTEYGGRKNNPTSELVGSQKDNAVTLHFDHAVQNFTAYFSAHPTWPIGRNIMFGGDMSLACG